MLSFYLQYPSFHVGFILSLKLLKPIIEVLLHLFRLFLKNGNTPGTLTPHDVRLLLSDVIYVHRVALNSDMARAVP